MIFKLASILIKHHEIKNSVSVHLTIVEKAGEGAPVLPTAFDELIVEVQLVRGAELQGNEGR